MFPTRFTIVFSLFAVLIAFVAGSNVTLGLDELKEIDYAARIKLSELVLTDYNKLIVDYQKLSSDCERNANSAEIYCEKECGKKPNLKEILKQAVQVVVSKAVEKIKRVGEKAGKLAKKLAKNVVDHTVKVLKGLGKAFKSTGKIVGKAIKGVRNVFRGVRRVVRRVVRVRLPRVRIPRIRLPRVRLPRVRLPRVRLPRVRVRFGRWGKKKRGELTKRQIEELTDMAQISEAKDMSERAVVAITCNMCELGDGLLNHICGDMKRTEEQLKSLEQIVNSLEESTVVKSVLYDDDSLEDFDEAGNPIYTSVFVAASLGNNQLSFKSNTDYRGNEDSALEKMGLIIGQEAYEKYKVSSG